DSEGDVDAHYHWHGRLAGEKHRQRINASAKKQSHDHQYDLQCPFSLHGSLLFFCRYSSNSLSSGASVGLALGLLGSEPKSESLASVPRWRTACRLGDHKLVSHAEQVPQDIGGDTGQANQHGTVIEIVVGHVVNIGRGCEQFGAVVEVNANHQR